MSIIIKDYQQGSQEWLEARKELITCSNALLLIDRGKNACRIANADAAARLTPNGNMYAERGHVLENEIREMFNDDLKKSGLEIREAGLLLNTEFPGAGYSPDGLVCKISDPTDKYFGIVEIKAYNDVVSRKGDPKTLKLNSHEHIVDTYYGDDGELYSHVYVGKHARACANYLDVPLNAQMQIQMELLISEAETCFLLLYNPDAAEGTPQLKIHEVAPDPELQEILRQRLKN